MGLKPCQNLFFGSVSESVSVELSGTGLGSKRVPWAVPTGPGGVGRVVERRGRSTEDLLERKGETLS